MPYTVEEARADAREWIKGVTVHDGTRGWRVACAMLDERITELERELADVRQKSWAWEHRATQRMALRKELEEAIGFRDGETYDDAKFAEAVARVKAALGN